MEDFLGTDKDDDQTFEREKVLPLRVLAAKTVANELNVTEALEEYIEEFKNVPRAYHDLIFRFVHLERFKKFLKHKEFSHMNTPSFIDQVVRGSEQHYRYLFASNPKSKDLDDPYLLLQNPYKCEDLEKEFRYCEWDEFDQKIPKVLQVKHRFTRYSEKDGLAIVPKLEDFERRWDHFTHYQFEFFNWDNVLAAGGCVLACLIPSYVKPQKKKKKQIQRYPFYGRMGRVRSNVEDKFDNLEKFRYGFEKSDIDLFIYGLTEEEANVKVLQILTSIRGVASDPSNLQIIKSKYVITVYTGLPKIRKIQIILRLYKSPAEILIGFDVDCCSVGYDGKNVYVSQRAKRAITRQYNLIDLTRRSPSYENRLLKYAHRGFCVAVPKLSRELIDQSIFEKPFHEVRGLAKLLLLEKHPTKEQRVQYLKKIYNKNNKILVPVMSDKNDKWNNRRVFRTRKSMERNRYRYRYNYRNNQANNELPIEFLSDQTMGMQSWYSAVDILVDDKEKEIFELIVKRIVNTGKVWYWDYNSDKTVKTFDYIKGNSVHHVLREVPTQRIYKRYLRNYSIYNQILSMSFLRKVPIKIEWITKNPGTQKLMTGSFNQQDMDDVEWYLTAYK
ncbi:reductase [Anaeramoeba flamelloides]|uniref:Reductase n=1 Tax=Anaeramoeba flamelloides TaxID=1746091 RepID=A0ABQ8Z126_9EUKA|nr:reductase [Anaeramoeba flamelloides]